MVKIRTSLACNGTGILFVLGGWDGRERVWDIMTDDVGGEKTTQNSA